MKIYTDDKNSNVFLGESFAQKNPQKDVEFLFPPNSTIYEPPKLKPNEVAVFQGKCWKIMPDFRGEFAVNLETDEEIKIDYIGNLKKGYMLLSEYQDSELYQIRILEQQKLNKKSEILAKINELDKKRIRAVCEPLVKDEFSGETWLDFYNNQIVKLREELKEMDYDS